MFYLFLGVLIDLVAGVPIRVRVDGFRIMFGVVVIITRKDAATAREASQSKRPSFAKPALGLLVRILGEPAPR